MLYPEADTIAHSSSMSAGEFRFNPSAKLFSTTELRKLRSSKQVAAVCFRIGCTGIEFLLVRTRNRRWTFPKGGVEPGLTHAQAAAIEAFEEAGVHGRMEQTAFARYVRRKCRGVKEVIVHAYLCEVLRTSQPEESNRNPTWFSADKAKQRLQENRKLGSATEHCCVVDRAVSRIQRLSAGAASIDPLQKVQFESFHAPELHAHLLQAPLAQSIYSQLGERRRSPAIAIAVNAHVSRLLSLAPSGNGRLLSTPKEQQLASSVSVRGGVPQQAQLIDGSSAPSNRAKPPRRPLRER